MFVRKKLLLRTKLTVNLVQFILPGLWGPACTFKIFIYREQLDAGTISDKEKVDIEVLAEYIALLHVPYFLQCPLAIAAPRLDRDFWVDVCNYKTCFNETHLEYDMMAAVQVNKL